MPALPEPRTAEGRAGLAAILAEPARAVVALDFDGTLSPIVERPEDARPAPGALAALRALVDRVGVLAFVTGRPAEQVVALSGIAAEPALARLVVLGQYGLQRWDGRTRTMASPPPLPGVAAVRAALPGVLRAAQAPPGTTVEDKGLALVVHTRQAADGDAALAALADPVSRLAEQHGLEPHPARKALELRPPGYDKGGAVRRLVEAHDAAAVLVAGDDVGDLAAYDTVEALRAQGVPGLTICSDSPEVTGLRERADLVVAGPAGVVGFLSALAHAIGDA